MTIVAGADGSDSSLAALEWTVAHRDGDPVVAVHGTTGLWLLETVQLGSQSVLEARDQRAGRDWTQPLLDAGVDHDVVVRGEDPANLLPPVAKEHDADAIVVGSTGAGGHAHRLVGGAPSRMLHVADRVVVVVPE